MQFDARPLDSGHVAPLTGRHTELEQLREAFGEVFERQASRATTLVGPGGVGKSRLVREALRELSERNPGVRIIEGHARSLNLSYGIFSRLFKARFGLTESSPGEPAAASIRRHVAEVLDDRKVGDVCYFLGQLLDIAFDESPLTRAVSEDPVQARLLRRAVVRSFLEADASRSPLVLVFEDLHFADDDSLELLRYLIRHLQAPVWLVCLARAELLTREPEWGEIGPRHRVMDVRPVSSHDAAEIMKELLSRCEGGAPSALIKAGVGMANGIPRHLEQMVRIFQDAGVLEQRSANEGQTSWRVNLERLKRARLPLTMDDAVAARVGALKVHERRLLEHAAVMGNSFWLGGLLALSRIERDAPELWIADEFDDLEAIEQVLDELVHRDYIVRVPDSTFLGELEFVFKQSQERERILALCNVAATRRAHQTLADWLAHKQGVRSQEEYRSMLARHLEQAGSPIRAALTYLEAADIARQAYAAGKAHEYYEKGLSLLGDADAGRRIDALHNHGDVLIVLGRTDEALGAFREMLTLAFRLGYRAKGGAAHNRIGRLFRDTGSLGNAEEHLTAALRLFQSVEDERGVAACHDDIGKLLWMRGEYERALKQMRTALEMRKKIGDRRSIALSLNNIGLVWMDHGQAPRAAEALEAALSIRREVADPLGVVQSLNNLGRLAQDQNQDERALELFEEAYRLATEVGERNRVATVLTNIGVSHSRLGNTEKAIEVLQQSEKLCEELGDRLVLAEAKRALAKAYLQQGSLRAARESIKEAVDLFGRIRSKAHLAVALRTLGEVTGAGAWGEGHEVRAVDYFMRSIAICKEIGNELEVAKSYVAFSEYVFSSEHYGKNQDIQREAHKLQAMADEIFQRHRIVA